MTRKPEARRVSRRPLACTDTFTRISPGETLKQRIERGVLAPALAPPLYDMIMVEAAPRDGQHMKAMTRAGHVDKTRLESARLLFEQMLGYANHLGLYAEETGPRGEALGNFPQAFTHLSLISAAYNLDRELGKQS